MCFQVNVCVTMEIHLMNITAWLFVRELERVLVCAVKVYAGKIFKKKKKKKKLYSYFDSFLIHAPGIQKWFFQL